MEPHIKITITQDKFLLNQIIDCLIVKQAEEGAYSLIIILAIESQKRVELKT